MASYDEYYLNQAGGKLPVFQGTKVSERPWFLWKII